MIKTQKEVEKDIAALNLVFRGYEEYIDNPNRFLIDIMKIDGQESAVVWDSKFNRVCYNFGDTTYYSKLMTKYAELPSVFDIKSA